MIATLPSTPALRREEIKLHVELITPLLHVRGYAAPETRAAEERARLLIEQAQSLGEPPEDPLLLFSALYGSWVANIVAFNGDVMRELAIQFLALAQKQSATAPAHGRASRQWVCLFCIPGTSQRDALISITRSRSTIRPSIASLATRFGQDVGATSLLLEVDCVVAARLSRRRARRRRTRP